jgi:hypothetical protein
MSKIEPLAALLYDLFYFLHYANKHDLPVALCPSVLDGSPETKRSYRFRDVARIFLVGMSAPAGMTLAHSAHGSGDAKILPGQKKRASVRSRTLWKI